jgi:predicted nucleotidyltransferase
MWNIDNYMERLVSRLSERFGSRLLYVGLQGSYLRGEATPTSDIDIMAVIDGLEVADLDDYRSIIDSMERADLSCGFICSKRDLENWNVMEMCQLLHGTKDYYGVLRELIPAFTVDDVRSYVKMSLNNMYHEICHRYIHADQEINKAYLPGTYKGVFFILQNLYYLTDGVFVSTKKELLERLDGKNRSVLERAMALQNGCCADFADSFALLFAWCQETMYNLG